MTSRLLMGLIVCLGHSTRAAAEDVRYALLIGARFGNGGSQPLKYATADAERLAQVLTDMGGFLAENVVVLADPEPNRIRSALGRLNARIRNEQVEDKKSLLLVYYSGHADALSLQLRGAELPWDDLRNLTSGSAATARILIVDACRSGSATRVKGTRLDSPFALPPGPLEPAEGFAVLSSAAAGEDAQESDELGGSFFTHHLLAALRGVADGNADGAVTLGEAYGYAAQRTITSSASTLAGVQHPTYAYDLKGRGDLVLTRLGASAELAGLVVGDPGQYFFHRDGPSGPLELEVNVGGAKRLVLMRPGQLFVRRRVSDRLYEGEIELAARATQDLDTRDFRVIEYAQLVRKGGQRETALSIGLGAGLSAPLLRDYEIARRGSVLLSLDMTAITLDLQFVAGLSTVARHEIAAHASEYAVSVGARRVVDIDRLSVSGGIRGGVALLRQSYDTERIAPNRKRLLPTLDTLLRADVDLFSGVGALLELGVRVTQLQARTGLQQTETQRPVQPHVLVGVAKVF